MDPNTENFAKKNAEHGQVVTELSDELERERHSLQSLDVKPREHEDNNSINETTMTHELLEMDLLAENQALKNQINDLKNNLEAERKARDMAEQRATYLKEQFDKCLANRDKERKCHLDTIKTLKERIESAETYDDSVLREHIRVLENTISIMNCQKDKFSASDDEPSKHAAHDSSALNSECMEENEAEPNSFVKSETSVILTLGLSMLLSGQRQMNLDGILSLYTGFFSEEEIDDDDHDAWRKCFVKVAACKMNGKMENISSVAERLLNNEHTQLFQDPVEGVHVEKSKFDDDEVKCLQLICNAMCIEFTAS